VATDYSHDQLGTLVLAAVGGFGLLLLIVFITVGAARIVGGVALAFLLLTFLFYRLRVEVSGGELRICFGVGLIGRTFDVHEIVSARPVRNKWWYGWGIRLTPHGWLFNVSGFDAVEIELRSGRHYRIGTDEPEVLSNVLNRAISA
jgi:hypothetical protein